MINLACSEGQVELYVKEEKLKENVGGEERVGAQTQLEPKIQQKTIETNQPSEEIEPIRNETQAETQPQIEPETQPETNENQPETDDSDGDDEYILVDEHETDVSDGEDSISDEELLEARRCSRRLRNKFG